MVRLLNGFFGLAVLVVLGGLHPRVDGPIWVTDSAERRRIADLEEAFAQDRGDPDLGAELADEYLHQNEPEIAVAALRTLDLDAQRDPVVQHRLALAYADMGQLPDAVASARFASARCQHSLEEEAYAPALRRCSETTLTRIEMNRSALERLQSWGIVDPHQDPARTKLAYDLSYRVARLAVSAR